MNIGSENEFISNGWRWSIHFKQDGIAVAHVTPESGQVTRDSGWELNILEPSGRWSMVAGHCFDYGYDGKDVALGHAEQLVEISSNQRMGVAAGLYSKHRGNVLFGTT
jgi:hypothetical protein